MFKRMMVCGAAFWVLGTAGADPLQDALQIQGPKAVNQLGGNVATGSLTDTTVNATATAQGDDAYAVAGAVVNRNRKKNVVGRQRGEVNLKGAQIDAHAEAAAGKEAFAGAYINK